MVNIYVFFAYVTEVIVLKSDLRTIQYAVHIDI